MVLELFSLLLFKFLFENIYIEINEIGVVVEAVKIFIIEEIFNNLAILDFIFKINNKIFFVIFIK